MRSKRVDEPEYSRRKSNSHRKFGSRRFCCDHDRARNLGLIKRDFAALWQPVPKRVPAREILIYVCALVPLASGLCLLWKRAAAVAARVLLAFLLLWLLVLRVPLIFISPTVDTWWASAQTAVMTAATWVLYV